MANLSLTRKTAATNGTPSRRRRGRDHTPRPDRDLEGLTAGALYDLQLHGVIQPTGTLTAAALNVRAQNAQDVRRLIQPWQARAMSYYDLVPEVKFAAGFMSHMLRKVRLFPATLDPDTHEPEELHDGPIYDAFARIQDRNGGRDELQGSYGKLKFLIGECYLTVSPDLERGEVWECLSPNELRVQPGGLATRFRAPMLSADQYIIGNDEATVKEYGGQLGPMFTEHGPDVIVVYRLWRPHPAYSWLADANMQSAIDILEELVLSTYSVRAQLKSRLNQAGLLLMPDEISFASLGNEPDEDPNADLFQQRLENAIMAAIGDPGSAAAFSPIVVRMAGEFVKNVQHIKFNDTAGELAEINQRAEMVERFGVGAELPPDLFRSQEALNHWCVDEETEVLTRDRGWITHHGLTIGDIIRTLNHDTGLAEWQPVLDLYRAKAQDEPMRLLETRTHSSLTTLNHRWPVLRIRQKDGKQYLAREWTTTRELMAYDKIITGAFSGDEPAATQKDDLVELAAWYWTEGSRSGAGLSIAQSHTRNPQRVDRIRGALTRLFGPARPSIGNLDEPAWRETIQANTSSYGGPITVFYLNRHAAEPIHQAAPSKRPDPAFLCSLTRAQLDLFIDVSCQADGHHYHAGILDIWQRDADGLDGYELAVVLSGRAASRQPSHDKGTTVSALRTLSVRPVKAAAQRGRTGNGTACDEIVSYTGIVWCPVTKNHTWLARRNGRSFFTGNTGWLIDEQTWKSYGHPAALEMASDFCAAYLQPAAREAGVTDWENIRIGIDASDVINHPDRAKDADALYAGRAISKKVWRESKGYNDNDEMPPDEINEAIGVAIRDGSLALYGIPQVRGGTIEPAAGEIESPTGQSSEMPTPTATGVDAERGAPATGPSGSEALAAPSLQASAATAALEQRILGAADFAVHRGRELAGARLRAMTSDRGPRDKRCADCQTLIDGVANWDVAAVLGAPQVAAVAHGENLADGTGQAFAAVLERMGVAPSWASELGDLVEIHVNRTLYQDTPDQLPAGFAGLLRRISLPLERT